MKTAFGAAFAAIAAVGFAGCAQQNASLPSSPRPDVAARHSWMEPGAKPKQILYVSDPYLGVVNLYDPSRQDPRPIGQLADFKRPEGLLVDTGNDIFVTDAGERRVIGYREGSLFPFFAFEDPSGHPNDICNQAYSPTFYVVNATSAGGGYGQTIDVYANESRKPTATLTDSNASALFYCAVDQKGDLFVTLDNTAGGSNSGEIDEFPSGKTTPVVLIKDLASPAGILLDVHDNLVVSDTFAHEVDIFAPPYKKGYPKSSFGVNGLIVQIALDETATHLWGADAAHAVAQELSYPDGVLENETKSVQLFGPAGVAIAPPELRH